KAALEIAVAEEHDDDVGVRLLADIQSVFNESGEPRLSSADLVSTLAQIEESPWGEWKNGQPMTTIALSRQLKPFGIKPKVEKIAGATHRGYERCDFEDAWSRYVTAPLPESTRYQNPIEADSPPSQAEYDGNESTRYFGPRRMRALRLSDLGNVEIHRLLSTYRPELLCRDDITTRRERLQIAGVLKAGELRIDTEIEEAA